MLSPIRTKLLGGSSSAVFTGSAVGSCALASSFASVMSLTPEGLRSRLRRVQHQVRRQNGLSLQQISCLRPQGLRTPWRSNRCAHCNALLLAAESTSWCCSGGRKVLFPLPPLPARISQLVTNVPSDISDRSRELNYLFSLSAVGVSGLTSGWSRYTGELLACISIHFLFLS